MVFGKTIPYDIKITPTMNNGFIVKVGCATLVFSDNEGLLQFLREYLADPKKLEKEYNLANHANGPEPASMVDDCDCEAPQGNTVEVRPSSRG